jgi:predicted transposase YbfD/YdcC
MPDLKGCVLTMDAKHDVRDTFIKIVEEKHGHFFICVKENAATLLRYINRCFEQYEGNLPRAETRNRGHGRIEHRIVEVLPISPAESGWPYTKVACRITRNRKTVRKNIVVNESEETVFYVGSMAADSRSPAEFLNLSRGHWIIENGLHYHKDRSLDEDRNPAAEQKSGRVMCFLRSITALILGKAKEPLNVVKMRLALNLRLLMGLLSSDELSQWLKRYQPFTPQ